MRKGTDQTGPISYCEKCGKQVEPHAAYCQKHEPKRKPNKEELRKIQRETELLDRIETLKDYLLEAHQSDIDDDHAGDDLTVYPCSYCQAIEEAEELLKERS